MTEINLPLPPPRPTVNFRDKETEHEYEQLVTSAISVEENFRRRYPKEIDRNCIVTDPYQVLDMVLLPGGKYLVTSIRDKYRFYIAVYHLDHRDGAEMLTRLPTTAKAYNLQAKYMKYKGKSVVMIAYVCRTFKAGTPANEDPSELSHKYPVDPYFPVMHDVVCARIDLQTLDDFAGMHRECDDPIFVKRKLWAQKIGGPFTQTFVKRVKLPVNIISLYERKGVPYFSVAQVNEQQDTLASDDTIIMVNLETLAEKVLTCGLFGYTTPGPSVAKAAVKGVRHLPLQDSVLILRHVVIENTLSNEILQSFHSLEVMDIPNPESDSGFVRGQAPDTYSLGSKKVVGLRISDYTMPSTNGHDTDVKLRTDSQPLPPISVFVETADPGGIIHHFMWPAPRRRDIDPIPYSGPQDFYYSIEFITDQTVHQTPGLRTFIIPGVWRGIVYSIDENDRRDAPSLRKLRRYLNPEFTKSYPVARVNRNSDVQKRALRNVSNNAFGDFLIWDLDNDFVRYREEGLAAIAFDETVGRLCIATGNVEGVLDIYEFGYSKPTSGKFMTWKRERPEGLIEIETDEDLEFLEDHNERPIPKRLRRPEGYREHKKLPLRSVEITQGMETVQSMEIDDDDLRDVARRMAEAARREAEEAWRMAEANREVMDV
ncbi:hypothetical protein H0H92_008261 [Tricholoma furcatifolium]|nr:hypothetical protein H0H92_008261 [Tricholoma furcatifolium]